MLKVVHNKVAHRRGPDMNGGAGQQDNGTKHGDNVQDADFEEVK